jgi:hypothetical protein
MALSHPVTPRIPDPHRKDGRVTITEGTFDEVILLLLSGLADR